MSLPGYKPGGYSSRVSPLSVLSAQNGDKCASFAPPWGYPLGCDTFSGGLRTTFNTLGYSVRPCATGLSVAGFPALLVRFPLRFGLFSERNQEGINVGFSDF